MRVNTVFRQIFPFLKSISLTCLSFLLAVQTMPALGQQAKLEPEFPPSPPLQNTNLPPTETAYTLGPGDRIKVDIYQVQDYSGEYTVLVDGTLSLPLIGSLQVGGLTLAETTQMVTKGYGRYLRRPIATVTLISPRPLKIAIAGEINRPGSYTLTLNKEQKFPTVTELIQQAGGITTVADLNQVKIRRNYQGQQQIFNVNLWQLLQTGILNQDLTLRDGDSVFIPTVDKIDVAQTRQLTSASFGIQVDKAISVAIVGEVNRPGSYIVSPEKDTKNGNTDIKVQPVRLSQAISLAGGIKPLADIRNIEVRRSTSNGSQQIIDVNLWELLKTGQANQDLILQEGDTIVIPQAQELAANEAESLASASFSPATIRVNVVGEVKKPGTVDIPPNTPLNQAILAAGGFDNNRASKTSVELIRLNPNGTVSKREIPVDLAQGINEENNPTLRANDVIVVNRSSLASTTDTLGTILSPLGGIFSIFRIFGLF